MSASIGKRVIVIGSSNSGKSTLAAQLAKQLGAPYVELDALFWEPNWGKPSLDVFRDRVAAAIVGDTWVVAGNYTSQQQDVSWPRADTIVWLDLPLRVVLWRCVKRTWGRYRSQELLWGTNRENFWEHLMLWNPEKSLISYTITRYQRRRREFEVFLRDPRWSHLNFVRLRTWNEVERWVDALENTVPMTQER